MEPIILSENRLPGSIRNHFEKSPPNCDRKTRSYYFCSLRFPRVNPLWFSQSATSSLPKKISTPPKSSKKSSHHASGVAEADRKPSLLPVVRMPPPLAD